MPTLVNYGGGGGDEFYSGASFCPNPLDLARFCSVDVYYPPQKRARLLSSPYEYDACIKHDHGSSQRPSIEALPDECLFEIFRRIPAGRDRSSTASVSKHWLFLLASLRKAETFNGKKALAADHVEQPEDEMKISSVSTDDEEDGYLTRCLQDKKATDVRLAAVAVGTSTRGGLAKLSIRGNNSYRGVTDRGLSCIARACPSLKALSLWSISSISDEGLFEVARECRSLEKLDLCRCPCLSSKGLIAIAKHCPNLTALSIESCSMIGNEGLEAIGRFCPRLQSVSIKDCPLVGDRGAVSLVSSAPSVLSKIRLQGLNITDFSLAVIGHYGQAVTSLVLSGLKNVTEKGFWVMGNAQGLKRLASLTIISCGLTDVGLEVLGNGCPNLKQVCLQRCYFISDNGLLDFVRAAGSLESLQLMELNRVSQVGVIGVLSNCGARLKTLALSECMGVKDFPVAVPDLSSCQSLRCLSIQNCPGFGNAGVALVGKLCPNLHHLEFTGLWGIKDAALLPLLESCEDGLVKVNLSDCPNVTDEAISALVMIHGGTLQMLNIDGCRKVTDASLEAIADNCLLINDLDLSKCAVTDAGISVLSSAEQINLRVLSLSGCSQVTNKSVPFLKRLGGSLVGLNLQHCCSISSASVELLAESLWRCDILY
ncbi:EIN3-binding F-box protein 1-like [Punica granatum]|uniref:F-box/LRR-repeat protein 15-like leucin rich repeat domain-containing protein n=2 Tax=Punica granatum TaxID=22663 RepID=A0A218WGT7_PUNGR|nr:EIN3-binding F-box protein 1-like [Punica granatum]OWM71753.1 hypothetical protein CDL15_Pgr005941 [Punica granatum]PKI61211.1 hypothetical protein CRG98_018402 [Punica granatum]